MSASKLHLIYIPGLGDRDVSRQASAVDTWRWWGVSSELFHMNWGDKEPWKPKFDRLLARVDELTADGQKVALVGASAGATAVINLFAARKDVVIGAVCIAGKINHPETIGERYSRNNPSFLASANYCQASLASLDAKDRKRIMSRYAIFDERVLKRDSRVPGGVNRLLTSVGHVPTIVIQLVLGAPLWIRFLKGQNKKFGRD